jgi:hypothetical protein
MYAKEVRASLAKVIQDCILKANRGEEIKPDLIRIPTLHLRVMLPEHRDLKAVVNLLENWIDALNNVSETLRFTEGFKVNEAERLLYASAEQLKKNQEITDPLVLKFEKIPVEKSMFAEIQGAFDRFYLKMKSKS